MSWLHLNVAPTIGNYPLMYLLPIWCYGMILKLTLTTFNKMVDWGKTKWHNISKYLYANFLKHDFEWTQEWLWCLNNVKVNTIESTFKVLNFASRKGNGYDALMRFSILMGLKVSGCSTIKVTNLVLICLKRCSLVKQVLHVGQFAAIGAHAFFLGLLKA